MLLLTLLSCGLFGGGDDDSGCLETLWWVDVDGDGHGSDVGVSACEPPSGYVEESGDCDDGDPDIYPGAPETCDGRSEDCDAPVDEYPSDAPDWFLDDDGDGYGDPEQPTAACEAPAGYVENSDDCDDSSALISPETIWLADMDGDGFGAPGVETVSCEQPSDHVALGGDCDDEEPEMNPGLDEICRDGLDNDCDGGFGGCILDADLGPPEAEAALVGVVDGDGVGASVDAGVDVDADGALDLIVGAPGVGAWIFPGDVSGRMGVDAAAAWTTGGGDAVALVAGEAGGALVGDALEGTVRLFWGPLSGELTAPEATLMGDGSLGAALAAGALGASDWLVVGAPAARDSGAVWLAPLDVTGSIPIADVASAWYADSADAEAGAALALGDFDGDGLGDLLVGGPNDDDTIGAAWMLLAPGPGGGSLEDADAILRGDDDRDVVGAAVAAGDLDGDGYDEILVGAPGDGAGGEGQVFVFVGGLTPTLGRPGDASWSLSGGIEGGGAGTALAVAGDLDGDGANELAVGAPDLDGGGRTWLSFGPLSATSEIGDLRSGTFTVEPGARVGAALDAPGDLDGDGWPDLLIGAPGVDADGIDRGAIYLMLGSDG